MVEDALQGVVLSGDAVTAALEGCADLAELRSAIEGVYARVGHRFSVDMADAVWAALEQALMAADPAQQESARRWAESAARDGLPVALWVRARSLAASDRAVAAWDECVAALPSVVGEALLHRARARLRAGDGDGAAADLRLALHQPASFEFWNRAEKLQRRLQRGHDVAAVRSLRLAVLGGRASSALLVPLLRVGCFRDRIAVEIYEGEYDAWQQEILDPASGLYAFEPDAVLLLTHWRDAELPAFADDPAAAVDEAVARVAGLWSTLRERCASTILAQGFDLPAGDPYGRLGTALPGGRGAMLRAINARLAREAGGEILLLDLEAIAGEVGRSDWSDARRWHSARQHPGSRALVALVEHQLGLLRASLGLSRKVAVLDLDNTLWGGVVGEDGLDGIQLGPPSAAGEAYQTFQRYLRELHRRGVLLAVCSKNNPEDAREPFERHPETVLRLDDFVVFEANWEDKAANLRVISDKLSLGLDSFVFLDDNPVERAWVRDQHPDVLVPELPEDPADFVAELERGRPFEAVALSDEDRGRHESYRAEVGRQELRSQAGSLEGFLEGLQMVAHAGPFDDVNLPRIAQLVNKTNQFNVATRRYSEAQLRSQAEDPTWWTCWFRLADRFRDSGLIGVLTAHARPGDAEALEIDNWLMSCRVLGRQMEHFMLRTLLEHCAAGGIRRLYGTYAPTAKNAQVADLLERFGFRLHSDEGDGVTCWVLDVDTVDLPHPPIATGSPGR